MTLAKAITPIAYTLNEAATAVGLSVDSIREAINSNDLVPTYYGSKPLVDADELRRWFRSLPNEKPVSR